MNSKPKFKYWWRGELNKLVGVRAAVALLGLAVANSPAQKYTILHTFGGSPMGQTPSGLIQGPDGTLYGTTIAGGTANKGQVFKVNPDGTGYTALKNFNGTDGANPGGLLLSGTELFGTTANGGTNNDGTVFKLNTDGSGFCVLKQFTIGEGINPGSLVISGTTLFGTAPYGPAGTLFKMNTDGSGYAPLHIFTGIGGPNNTNADGFWPGDILLLNNVIYGATSIGGGFGMGTVYRINTDGTDFAKLMDFNGQNGAGPNLGVAANGTVLYGAARAGGTNDASIVFSLNTDGTGYTVLRQFDKSRDGSGLGGYFAMTNSTLYGAASWGGIANCGTVFKINTDGSGFAVLKEFTGPDSGFTPGGRVTLCGGMLYGITEGGGAYRYGTVFKIQTDGSNYRNVVQFMGADGAGPKDVVLSGSTIYGVTSVGGAVNNGTVFKIASDGSGYEVLKDFTEPADGKSPACRLVVSGQVIYGTTQYGTIFKLNTDGSGFTVLKDFTNQLDGYNPSGDLALAGSTLFGTTKYGGISNCGTVFRISTDGSRYTVLKQFAGGDGRFPEGGVKLSGTTLYGTTASGGSNGWGTVFALSTNGDSFVVLRRFTGGDDAIPGRILLSGSTIYGATLLGCGTLFKMNTDGSGYTLLHDFTNTLDGSYPIGELALSGSTLFGTTANGGISSGNCGTLFQINTNGSGFSVLTWFTPDDGCSPGGSVILSGSNLYGTTVRGGNADGGVLFALSICLPPDISVCPQYATAEAGAGFNLSVKATGGAPLSYQWFFNGTNRLDACTNAYLDLSNVRFGDLGNYTVVVSNAAGSVTSDPVVLNVIPPVERRPVPALDLLGETGSALNVEYADALGCPTNWLPLDTVNLTNPPQYCVDASAALPPQRFYRVWQTGTPATPPSLNLPFLVPAITLTGNIGDQLRLDCINQFGPTDAWVNLDTVTLTNTSQLYFDTSSIGQPRRLYRIVPEP